MPEQDAVVAITSGTRDMQMNAGFGPTKRPQLVGRLSAGKMIGGKR